jgi:hypothetical protein
MPGYGIEGGGLQRYNRRAIMPCNLPGAWEGSVSISGFWIRKLSCWAVGALALVAGVIYGRGAEASAIYTYSFTQAYTFNTSGTSVPATLTGGFSGTADAFGHITLATLTDFHISFAGGGSAAAYSGLPDYLSFKIGDTAGTTLFIQSPLIFGAPSILLAEVCTGLAVASVCNRQNEFGTVDFPGGTIEIAGSRVAPTVTLVSVATTPLPDTLFLFATALGGLGAAGAWRRKFALA